MESADRSRQLAEALAYIKSRENRTLANAPSDVDVAAIRQRLGMTQRRFAARFGFPVATLRHWERGNRKPRGAALVLLNVIARDPEAVFRALRDVPCRRFPPS